MRSTPTTCWTTSSVISASASNPTQCKRILLIAVAGDHPRRPSDTAAPSAPFRMQSADSGTAGAKKTADKNRQRSSEQLTRPGLEPGITEPKSVVLPITPSGSGSAESVVAQTQSRFCQFLADLVERGHAKVATGKQFVRRPLAQLTNCLNRQTAHALAGTHRQIQLAD